MQQLQLKSPNKIYIPSYNSHRLNHSINNTDYRSYRVNEIGKQTTSIDDRKTLRKYLIAIHPAGSSVRDVPLAVDSILTVVRK